MPFTEALDPFFADFGKPVVAGTVTGLGILDQSGEFALGGDLAYVEYPLLAPTATFGNLVYGQIITVDGVTFKVEYKPRPIDDGAMCIVPLMPTDETTPPANNDVGLSYYLSVFQ
jgi:hypothetical protein